MAKLLIGTESGVHSKTLLDGCQFKRDGTFGDHQLVFWNGQFRQEFYRWEAARQSQQGHYEVVGDRLKLDGLDSDYRLEGSVGCRVLFSAESQEQFREFKSVPGRFHPDSKAGERLTAAYIYPGITYSEVLNLAQSPRVNKTFDLENRRSAHFHGPHRGAAPRMHTINGKLAVEYDQIWIERANDYQLLFDSNDTIDHIAEYLQESPTWSSEKDKWTAHFSCGLSAMATWRQKPGFPRRPDRVDDCIYRLEVP